MKSANRWFLYGPFALAGVVLIIWFAVWRAGAATMTKSLDEWAALQRASGDTVIYAPMRARGFPFFLRGVVDDLAFDNGGFAYSADRLYLDALPYAFDRLIVSPGGEQRLKIGDDNWRMTAQDARASVEADPARGWFVKAQSGPAQAEGPPGDYALGRFLLNAAPNSEDASRLEGSIVIENFTTVKDGREGAVERAEAAFAVTGFEALQGANAVRMWRAGRGELIIHQLTISIGGAQITASGSLAIDDAGFPVGALTANITKPVGLVNFLGDIGALDRDEVDAAIAAFGLMAVAGNGVISAPIEFANGEARIGEITIARLGRVG